MTPHHYPVRSTHSVYEGRIIRLRCDEVAMPRGGLAQRDIVEHPGAVAVVALDATSRVLLVGQYRHAVGGRLWELPAGLRDVSGEDPWQTARRELAEEAGVAAARWAVLADVLTTPGMSNEAARVYLADGLSAATRPELGDDEESELSIRWLALPAAVEAVLAGRIRNALALTGILAVTAWRASGAGWNRLRPADTPWPAPLSSDGDEELA